MQHAGEGRSLAQVLRSGLLGAHRLPGSRLGPYVAQRELGRGGMGIVVDAIHEPSGQRVALKVLIAGEHATPTQRKRFLREAAATQELQSPGIVGVLDSGEIEGMLYLALEFVDGATLGDAFEDGLGVEEVITLLLEVADALAPAHTRGIVHRDLKPANVLIRAGDRRAVVADFGLVRFSELDSSLTKTGAMVGTPAYMAPEQIRGKPCSPATDVFALGAMLYEGLTGEVPFRAPNIAIRLARISQPPPPPSAESPEVSRALDAVVLRALLGDSGARYSDAGNFAAAVREALNAPEPSPGGLALKAGVLVAVLAIAAALAGVALKSSTNEETSVAPAPQVTQRKKRTRRPPRPDPRLWTLSPGDRFMLLYRMEEHDGVTAVWFDWEFEAQVQEEEGASVEIDCVLRSIRGAYGADGEGGGLPFDSRSPDLSHPLASLARVVDKTLSFRLDRRSGRVFKLAGLQAMAAPVLAGGAFGDTVATEAVTMRGYIVRSFANTYFERALDGVCHAAGDETPLRWRGARNAQKRFLSERHGEAAIGPISQTWRLHPSLRFELDGVAEFKDGRLVRAQVSQKLIGQLKGEKVIPVRATSLISWTVETKPLGSD